MTELLLPPRLLLTGLLCLLMNLRTQAQLDTAIILSPHLVDVPVDSFFAYVKQHTSFRFIYSSSLVRDLRPITYQQQQVPLYKILDTVLGRLGLGYTFNESIIRLHGDLQRLHRYNKADTLIGRVTDENGKPLGGVSVGNPTTKRYAITSWEGIFKLPCPSDSIEVEFTHVSYERQVLRINNTGVFLRIAMKQAVSGKEEVVIMAYHNISRRDNTASAYRVQGQDISRGSVNPIRELSGKVPGLLIADASGAPGAAIRVQLRGRQSIGIVPGVDNQPLNDPLMLVNKIPLATGNKPVTLLPSAAGDAQGGGRSGGGISAQAALNPEDIETIDILKDADATAIYGSRGAHGAILITTRMGRLGRPAFHLNMQRGAVASTHLPQLLDNRQYTAMRKEALQAANLIPTSANAPDLFLLDTNHYINVPQLLAGGTGQLQNIHASLQGGDTLLRYYLSAGYYRETSVMPRPLPQQRFTSQGNIRYRSPGRRLQVDAVLLYSYLHYPSIAADPMAAARVVPLLPPLLDEYNKPVWMYNNFHFNNPLGQFSNTNNTRINTFTGSLQGAYQLWKRWTLRSTLGYQWLPVKEIVKLPIEAGNQKGAMSTAHNQYWGMMAEPRLEYEQTDGDWQWGGLLGATFQEEHNEWNTIRRTGYESDAVLGMPGVQVETTENRYDALYRYHAVYGRWHTDWRKRYFINATGRLDASSRFGHQRKMAFFGALGGAWVFSAEKWMRAVPWLTHGKFRGSYGAAGNDQFEDYAYLETWQPQPDWQSYDGTVVLHPVRRANPLLGWEKNHKLELALELEAWQDLFLNVAWYRNITSDQLVALATPDHTAPIGTLVVNAPARVLNTGWELTLRSTNRFGKRNSYTQMLVLTLPHNRLLAFPGLEFSTYRTSLIVGEPLSVQRGVRYEGVDEVTGLYKVPAAADTIITGHYEPQAYAGWSHEWRLGQWRIGLFLEARKGQALHPLYQVYGSTPGRWAPKQLTNVPRSLWQQRWQQENDRALWQRFTESNTPATQQVIQYFRQSDVMMANASFWRIRSVYVGWDLPGNWIRLVKLCDARMYVQGQNLFTGTSYRDGDPGLLFPDRLPAQRIITAGVQIGF